MLKFIGRRRHNFGLRCCRGKSGCIPLPEIPVWEAVARFTPTTTSFPPPPSFHATSKPSTGQQRDLNALQYTKKWLHVMGPGCDSGELAQLADLAPALPAQKHFPDASHFVGNDLGIIPPIYALCVDAAQVA
ncbi:hypothetical protein B0H10DRAFT_2189234 [Mycena sp. CBHHK59/15]|nr:hypothetical protein B0H10DRAFT_2189234 [Mycena sp. CBHHK59/15]